MAEILTVPDAKARFDELVERVGRGEEFVVAVEGAPAVRIGPAEREAVPPSSPAPESADAAVDPRPMRRDTFGLFAHWIAPHSADAEPARPVRRPGLYAGRASIGPEFFEPLPEEELRMWEGGDEP